MMVLLGVGVRSVAAQETGIPRRAYAVGMNTTAGFLGVEWVARSFAKAPRWGGAVGVGILGAGARLNLALREPLAHTLVPYLSSGLSVGIFSLPPLARSWNGASIEAGIQVWPKKPRRLYVDVGVGAATEFGRSGDPLPALRIVGGRTF